MEESQPHGKQAPANSSKPILSIDELGDLATLDLIALRELPECSETIGGYRQALDLKLWMDFVQTRLSDAERELVRNNRLGLSSLNGKWDVYILDAAQRWGARLLLSHLVMRRVWSWQCGETDGIRKLKNLFHEMYHSARVGLRQAKGRVTDSHRDRKPDFVNELTELQIQVRHGWPDSAAEVRQLVADTIDATPGRFQYLKTNQKSLLLMLSDDDTALRFRGEGLSRMKGDLTPTKFYELWVASETNRDPESVRQDLYPK
jgi:hypothetical protein